MRDCAKLEDLIKRKETARGNARRETAEGLLRGSHCSSSGCFSAFPVRASLLGYCTHAPYPKNRVEDIGAGCEKKSHKGMMFTPLKNAKRHIANEFGAK